MGIFDRLLRRGRAESTGAGSLQAQLFDAAASGDPSQLEPLCRANRDAIVQSFPAWQTVPEDVRNDPDALQRYAHGLISVARLFAERLGDPSLFARLTGPRGDNPLVRWEQDLQAADALITELRYDEAQPLLAGLLERASKLSGTGVDALLPATLGRLGECHFQQGRAEDALPLMQRALEICERHGDHEGVLAYLGNLYEASRYLGRSREASECARRTADVLDARGHSKEAERLRKQAAVVLAGEPLNRVVAEVEGRRYELDEVSALTAGRVAFAFARNRPTLWPARTLAERGSERAVAGDYPGALALFREAARADAHDPNARYQMAFTLLHLRRYDEARAAYDEVEQLAPGWFQCRADRWLAEALALGTVDHETFLALHALEDGASSPSERVQLAERALARAPRVAALHLAHGENLTRLARHRDARAAFERGLACDADADVRSRILVVLGGSAEDPGERDAWLTRALEPGGNLVAAATASLLLRSRAQRAN